MNSIAVTAVITILGLVTLSLYWASMRLAFNKGFLPTDTAAGMIGIFVGYPLAWLLNLALNILIIIKIWPLSVGLGACSVLSIFALPLFAVIWLKSGKGNCLIIGTVLGAIGTILLYGLQF